MYPNLQQFQEYSRKSQHLEGKGYFFQKVLTKYMLEKPIFDNLFIKGDLLNQEVELSMSQFEILKASLPAIAGRARELAQQSENKKELERQLSGENEKDFSDRVGLDNLAEFKTKSIQIENEMRRGSIEFK